ncbi:MAG: c-type cytochrome [Gammaproteobacteria bacterium]|nr:c-type cytochrome [Gammaproteobacteria bacterium]
MLLLAMAAAAGAQESPERLYASNCSVCHGDAGDGNSHVRGGMQPPPRDFTASAAAAELSRERMIASVSNGRPGTAMVGWSSRLSAPEIASLVDYIRGRFMAARDGDAGRGARIFATNCSVCHGDNGAGAVWGEKSLNPPPRNFTAPAAREDLSRERMIASVTYGRPGTAMTSFSRQLPPEDVAAVVDYIRTTFMKVAAASVTAPAAGPYPANIVADAALGQAFYVQNCIGCHGIAGDGNGPRAYFIYPKPRNFIHPATRATYDRARLFAGIRDGVVGREMPAWGKVLSDQQIANLAEYVYVNFIAAAGNKSEKP